MPKKAMDILTESMFYVLMAFSKGPWKGKDRAGDSVHYTGKV